MKTAFLSAAFFLASAAGLQAASPPMITKQPEPATFAKSATGRFYVSAASTDGGYLTYQWRRSGPFTTPFADPNGAGKSAILYHASTVTIPEGTSATLTTTTPADAGYYYYWAEITNTKDGETAAIESAIVQAKVVDRTLEPQLMNGDFQTFNGVFPWTRDITMETPPLNTGRPNSGVANPTTGDLEFVPYWNTTQDAGTGNMMNYGKTTDMIIDVIDPDNHKAKPTTVMGIANTENMAIFIELASGVSSSIYQEIATVPGKIYEWSIDHAHNSFTSNDDILAVVIGPALNAKADYVSPTANRWVDSATYSRTFTGTAQQYTKVNPEGYKNFYIGNFKWEYPYGKNTTSYFNDIVNTLGNANVVAALAGQYRIVHYNDADYYVYVTSVSGPSRSTPWQTRSGVYTVPSGRGTTVFAFVAIRPAAPAGNGNALDNVIFASGSPISSEQEVSFTSEAQLSAATKPGYAYGLAEVRGSTATPLAGSAAAYYDADGAGVDSSEAPITANDKGWYIQTFAAAGAITFKNLTPGKVYRIVGIPAAAISPALGVNERPEYVLDEGYYADARILPVSAGDTATVWNIDLEAVGMKARATIKNARSDVEYALLDSAGGGVALAHEWTNWTTSDSKGRVRFNNLTLDTVYYLVVRPLGYGEVTYAEAAEAAVKVRTPSHPDLSVANIARPNYTTITIANTSSGYDYAAVDTKTGQIVEQKHGLDNTTLRFENLDERKAYQVVIRRAGGSWLKGVRVYPYPSKLYIDYVNETVRSSADSTGNIPVNVEYRIQKKKK